ncbi:hypothetical protein AX16_010160 [Volvariella volvacea WC 439]|nr:hypothetical protein AX16_010160 [Volvariella volvacea WC 439]
MAFRTGDYAYHPIRSTETDSIIDGSIASPRSSTSYDVSVMLEGDVYGWQLDGLEGELLPPYPVEAVVEEAPPVYSIEEEDEHVQESHLVFAKICFFLGFLLFPLWIFGSIELCFPPTPVDRPDPSQPLPPPFDLSSFVESGMIAIPRKLEHLPLSVVNMFFFSEMTPEDWERHRRERELEVVWARRCLWALGTFTVMAAIGVGGWLYMKN